MQLMTSTGKYILLAVLLDLAICSHLGYFFSSWQPNFTFGVLAFWLLFGLLLKMNQELV